MSQLLKPSKLRELLASLNALLAESSQKRAEINKLFSEQKSKLIASYNVQKTTMSANHSSKLNTLEKKFQQQQQQLENEKRELLHQLNENTEKEKNAIKKSFSEASETNMRHAREYILNQRREHEDNIQKFNAETNALNELLQDLTAKSEEYRTLLKVSNVKIPEKNLLEEFTKNLPEENQKSTEELLLEHDSSKEFDQLEKIASQNDKLFTALKHSPMTKLFLKFPPWLILTLITLVHAVLYFLAPTLTLPPQYFLTSFAITASIILATFFIYKITYAKRLKLLAKNLSELNALADFCRETNRIRFENDLRNEAAKLKSNCENQDVLSSAESNKLDLGENLELRQLKSRFSKTQEEIFTSSAAKMEKIAQEHSIQLDELENSCETELTNLKEKFELDLKNIQAEEENQLAAANALWEKKWLAKLEEFEQVNQMSKMREKEIFPPFSIHAENWQPLSSFDEVAQFGTLKLDLFKELEIPNDGSFENKGSLPFSIPAALEFPHKVSLMVTTKGEGRDKAVDLLKNTVLRLLMSLPPGKARFNFIDPLSLGETFAGFMHLNDYKAELTGGRIATNSRQIEQYLADLNEHMETVIQKYLRNEFSNICDYNQTVGEIAEPFRFLVIADFPVNFSEEAVKRILSIAKSGSRCGVYIILHRDGRHPIPGGFDISDIEKLSINVNYLYGDLDWKNCGFKLADFELETPPDVHQMNELIKKIGAASINANRVEIPFAKVQHPQLQQNSSADELSVAIGLTGAKKQEITFGHGTNQHCLIAGKTGSGKSNLIHIIICNLAIKYSPEELEFYLIDFKKGVEFKPYATCALPHAKAIAIESDRQFGLSVLRKLDKELQERGEILRRNGLQNISQYRHSGEKMARILLVIDEFQEIFVEDDNIAQESSLLLDRIVRQGRAFGMHVILGSQTLAGSYSLPRATMGQMTIRIALQCSESDSYIILSETNSAARLLERPGEAIYNDKAGLPDGNTPFQTAFLTDSQKITILNSLQKPNCKPFVFEGNIPADITQNTDFAKLLSDKINTVKNSLIFGEPNAIRPAMSAQLEPATGQNILIVGQNEENALAIMISSICSLSLTQNENPAEIFLFDGSTTELPRDDYFAKFAKYLPAKLEIVKPNNVESVITKIKTSPPSVGTKRYLFFFGFHRFRKLRQADSFSWDDSTPSAGKELSEIFSEGPEKNIHSILWCDSWSSLSRMAPRKMLNDFDFRILFQLSQADAVALTDSSEASKLGLHTALLYNEQTGESIKFRPFSLPHSDWFENLPTNQTTS